MNDYGRDLCNEAVLRLTRVTRELQELDHNLAFVEGMETNYNILQLTRSLISELSQSYYMATREQGHDD